MMWTKARLTTYIGAAIVGLAFVASILGAGTYDQATGTFDLHPFNVYWLAGIIAGPVSAGLSALAVVLKWGVK
jgi:hypothetical protein